MEYEPEELLAIMEQLAEQYTSFESSSVTYDTAQMLMEAVLYCIEECCTEDGTLKAVSTGGIGAKQAYDRGYELVKEKVYRAKELYEQILEGFDDYGCWNYRDTILKGIPAFFLRYDPKFAPQNHIIALDYPVLHPRRERKGVDKIFDYLEQIAHEQRFLSRYNREEIKSILRGIVPEYEELYLDNICFGVLSEQKKTIYEVESDEQGLL